jgi:signal peptidase I
MRWVRGWKKERVYFMDQIYETTTDTALIRKIHTPTTPPRRDSRWRQGRIIKQALIYLLIFAAAYGCFRLSHRYVIQVVQVDGASMAPTLQNGQSYFLNRLVYGFRDPQPMDIVTLQDPQDHGFAVKRVVAKPGDRIYLSDGKLFVNGKALAEPYLERTTKTYPDPRYRAQLWICGQNQYFVLGDNRNRSSDSRLYGAVPRENILGMIVQLNLPSWF